MSYSFVKIRNKSKRRVKGKIERIYEAIVLPTVFILESQIDLNNGEAANVINRKLWLSMDVALVMHHFSERWMDCVFFLEGLGFRVVM